jgi:hypothetical protein
MARYLYHVTYLFNLPSIAHGGLGPGFGQNFGPAYAAIASSWLFLTEADGVSFWASRLEQHAEANTDHPEGGWAPVVISIAVSEELALELDTAGTRDASAQAWRTKDTIPVESLTYWNGEEWAALKGVDTGTVDDMLGAWLDAGVEQFEDEEEGSWWDLRFDFFLPPDEELIDEDES